MRINVSPNNPIPLYQQIVDQLRTGILRGELSPGDPLPSIRQLANQLLASVITTKRAYSELEAEGLIVTRAGLGTFVADLGPNAIIELKREVVMERLEEGVRVARQLRLDDDETTRLFVQALDGSDEDV